MKLCLGNGANACFVLDGRLRFAGQVTLESIRAAVRAAN